MNKINYNDYDFIEEHPTLKTLHINNFYPSIAEISRSIMTIIGDTQNKLFIDTITNYIEEHKIAMATIIDEKSLLDTLLKASKYEAIEKALDLLKQKRENAKSDLVFCHQQEAKIALETQIATYTDCIATIEAEMGRTER